MIATLIFLPVLITILYVIDSGPFTIGETQ